MPIYKSQKIAQKFFPMHVFLHTKPPLHITKFHTLCVERRCVSEQRGCQRVVSGSETNDRFLTSRRAANASVNPSNAPAVPTPAVMNNCSVGTVSSAGGCLLASTAAINCCSS